MAIVIFPSSFWLDASTYPSLTSIDSAPDLPIPSKKSCISSILSSSSPIIIVVAFSSKSLLTSIPNSFNACTNSVIASWSAWFCPTIFTFSVRINPSPDPSILCGVGLTVGILTCNFTNSLLSLTTSAKVAVGKVVNINDVVTTLAKIEFNFVLFIIYPSFLIIKLLFFGI